MTDKEYNKLIGIIESKKYNVWYNDYLITDIEDLTYSNAKEKHISFFSFSYLKDVSFEDID